MPESTWTYNGDGTWSFTDAQKQKLFAGKFDSEKADAITGQNQIWLDHPQGLMSDDRRPPPGTTRTSTKKTNGRS